MLRQNLEEHIRRYKPSEIDIDETLLEGDYFKKIVYKVVKIIRFQFEHRIRDGIKGFLFYGPPGTGKTTAAKLVAKKLGVPLFFIDGADIARPLYGHSEQRIRDIFNHARKMAPSIILIDDVESIFMRRSAPLVESWHIAQDNVFFHMLDELDTSKNCVILTTNKYELVDDAIIDRLYPIEFPKPDRETLIKIATTRARRLLGENFAKRVEYRLRNTNTKLETIRDALRMVMELYIETITT